jgi:hypothetical protein
MALLSIEDISSQLSKSCKSVAAKKYWAGAEFFSAAATSGLTAEAFRSFRDS